MIDSNDKINTQEKEIKEHQKLLKNIYISKQFIQFLNKNKALKPYLRNLKRSPFYRLATSNCFFVSTFIKKTFETDPTDLIGNGFNWEKSKEGFDYWCKMHTSWCNTYYECLRIFFKKQK